MNMLLKGCVQWAGVTNAVVCVWHYVHDSGWGSLYANVSFFVGVYMGGV